MPPHCVLYYVAEAQPEKCSWTYLFLAIWRCRVSLRLFERELPFSRVGQILPDRPPYVAPAAFCVFGNVCIIILRIRNPLCFRTPFNQVGNHAESANLYNRR